jgi:threonylcarbamoyladenosine tRNA methylthiotransferase MtaB
MPQVNGAAIKGRAAQLRAAGDRAVARHLADQVGQHHPVLMENPHMGRTPQFTEVSFADPQTEGAIVAARITGIEGYQLTATPVSGPSRFEAA